MSRERYSYRMNRIILQGLRKGAVIKTVTLGEYGTTTENELAETVIKTSDAWVWTDLGNRYSRKTGERWGDGDSRWPRCIYEVTKHAQPEHPVLVKMERVGRRHGVEFTVDWPNEDDFEALLDAIGNRIAPMLMSAGTVVQVTRDGKVIVEFGRYGTGTWERVAA